MFVLILMICTNDPIAAKCGTVEISQPFATQQACNATGEATARQQISVNAGTGFYTRGKPETLSVIPPSLRSKADEFYSGNISWFFCLERKD